MNFAENFKKFRETSVLSQVELSEKVSANQSMISRIEIDMKIPSLALSFEISQGIGTTVDELCKGA